jgi:hypothetical protein
VSCFLKFDQCPLKSRNTPNPRMQVRMCMIVECNQSIEYDSAKEDEGVRLMQRRVPENDMIDFEIPGGIPVHEDVHVRFFVFEVCLVP